MPNTDPYSASFTGPDRLHVDALSLNGDSLIVGCRLRGSQARCPVCGGASRRVHARGTERQREALQWIAFALGGEAGARLARELGLLVSPDTLLNRIRGASSADVEGVRVLGVDDFGFKRGNASGTILVDLERHKIVDLLRGHSKQN
jgi:hypothetical protein